MRPGPNCKHHLSHTDSVRLRLLLTIRFGQFGGDCGAAVRQIMEVSGRCGHLLHPQSPAVAWAGPGVDLATHSPSKSYCKSTADNHDLTITETIITDNHDQGTQLRRLSLPDNHDFGTA